MKKKSLDKPCEAIIEVPRQDYSSICSHNDDADVHCWFCTKFVFPVGCMPDELNNKSEDDGV